jgi:hypothetical protein
MRRERRGVVWGFAILFVAISLTFGVQPACAQVVIDPFYAGNYAIVFQGPIPSVPSDHGGITFKFGDPNTLLVCGAADSGSGAIYSIGVTRDPDTGHINGFVEPAVYVATAVNCDGGLAFDPFDPNNVLFYSRWPSNELGQIGPASSITDKVIALAPLGVEDAHSALNFVPPGFPAEGNLKMVTWGGGQWNDATLSLDATGITYDLATVTEIPASRLTGGPEGIFYVPTTSPLFGTPSILVLDWSAGTVVAYQVDANSDPVVSTGQLFMSAPSPDQPEGVAQDPISGDFLFGTFPGPDVIIVSGFQLATPGARAGPR